MPGTAQGGQGGSPREADPALGTEIPAANTWKEPRKSEIKGKRWREADYAAALLLGWAIMWCNHYSQLQMHCCQINGEKH